MLKVEGLTLVQNQRAILNKINLEIKKNEIHTLLGVNGVGKSRLAYCIMGCSGYKIKEGKVYFEGKDITEFSLSQRAKLGITLAWQESAQFEGITVKDYLSLSRKNGNDSLKEILDKVDLNSKLYLDREVGEKLSGGERKRIELASVYAMRPKMAILDEPDSGIDMLSLKKIKDYILSLKERGSSIFLITHREEVTEISDKISLMCRGEIVKSGDPDKVRDYFKRRCGKTCNLRKKWDERL
ncbi:MAG: ABC transporter ATP-binding protein [Candidatus Aerophobetes bacterium]|nr:ABC transporter ATP-binding protein [Candidatus Aerophobetes bacterium]